jgi:hypothetical protein
MARDSNAGVYEVIARYPSAMRRAITCAAICALLLTGCGGDDPPNPPQSTPSEAPQKVPPELEGVVTKTDGSASFTMRSEGKAYEIFVDESIDYGFPLSHLKERLVGAGKVLVETEMRDGQAVAVHIEEV